MNTASDTLEFNATAELALTNAPWSALYITLPADTPFWGLTCPCGVTVNYKLNELPTVTTKHPCEHPDHWTITFKEPAVSG